jgi:MYXO-CTERM domain-containing protein
MLTLTNANTYAGGTTVSNGILYLNHTGDSNPAITGNVAIAGAGNNATYGKLFLKASDQLASSASVSMSINTATYNSYCAFTLGGYSQTISGLSFTGSMGGIYIQNAGADTEGLISNNGTLTINNTSDITASSVVYFRDRASAAGYTSTGTLAVVKDGAAALTIGAGSGTVTNTGGWTLKNGTLKLAGDLGSTVPVALNGGTLSSNGTTARSVSGAVTLGGNVILGDATSTGKLTLSGAGTLTGNRTLTIASDVDYTGAIGQDVAGRSLTKEGAGKLTLTNTNTYTGTTTVAAGVLALSGGGSIVNSSVINVQASGDLDISGITAATYTIGGAGAQTLKGSGDVIATGKTLELGGNAILAPGSSTGTLSILGNLAMTVGSSFDYEFTGGGTAADLINLVGNLNLGGATFNPINLGTFTPGDKFALFSYSGSLTGTFGGIADNTLQTFGGGDWLVDYDDDGSTPALNVGSSVGPNYVTITAVPEPSAMTLGLLAAAGLLLRRRRRS